MKLCNVISVMLFSILLLFTSCDLFDYFNDDESEENTETLLLPSSGEMYDKYCNFTLEMNSADKKILILRVNSICLI